MLRAIGIKVFFPGLVAAQRFWNGHIAGMTVGMEEIRAVAVIVKGKLQIGRIVRPVEIVTWVGGSDILLTHDDVFSGKLDSFVSVTQGKMKLSGQLGQLSKWYVPFTRLFALFKEVKII